MINLLVYLGLYISKPSLHLCREKKAAKLYSDLIRPMDKEDLKYRSGDNEAIFNDPDDSEEKLYRIKEIFNKKKLLLLLESNTISQNDKLDLINKDINPLSYSPSIMAGGLMDDWDFDLHKE